MPDCLSLEGWLSFSKAFGLFPTGLCWFIVLNSEFFHLRFVDTFGDGKTAVYKSTNL